MILSRDNFTTQTFSQVVAKARDFEDGLRTESGISQRQLEESFNKVSLSKPTDPSVHPASGTTSCVWCGRSSHPCSDCPAKNHSCHGCGKRGHWKLVCKSLASAKSVNVITDLTTLPHQAPTGIFVDLEISTSSGFHPVKFQVDSGCSCNPIHQSDLRKFYSGSVTPSNVRLLDYSKSLIPTKGQVLLPCRHRDQQYDVVFQVITSPKYHTPLLGLANSTRMGILQFEVDHVHQLAAAPIGELTLDYITSTYPDLFEGLGELGPPLSLKLSPDVKSIQAAPHRFSAPKLPMIKEAVDKPIQTSQLVRENEPTPWVSNMVVRERPATATKPAKVRIMPGPLSNSQQSHT